jgi:hypothetical protein
MKEVSVSKVPYRPGQVVASEQFLDNLDQLPKFIEYFDFRTGKTVIVQAMPKEALDGKG